jgi:hypothetical protein
MVPETAKPVGCGVVTVTVVLAAVLPTELVAVRV